MDSAARAKCRKYTKACADEGWDFMPFVTDTFGAVRSDARSFVSSVIKRKGESFAPLLPHEAGQAIWSAVSGAAVYRAASQLSRTALLDSPAEMPLALLDLTSVRALRTTELEAAGTPQPQRRDMGTSLPPLPSPVSLAAGSPMGLGLNIAFIRFYSLLIAFNRFNFLFCLFVFLTNKQRQGLL